MFIPDTILASSDKSPHILSLHKGGRIEQPNLADHIHLKKAYLEQYKQNHQN